MTTQVKNGETGKTDAKATATLAKKRAAFGKLAPPRMTKALKAIRQVEKLTSRAYDWDASQAAQMANALETAVKRVTDGLNKSATPTADEGFAFAAPAAPAAATQAA
jgi:hypothetical protein